ncbi:MAG: ChbG/HpnK family deacetylase [Thiobacillaceae bacterium]
MSQPEQMTPRRMICICVDDFGMHEGINRAALNLAATSRVSAISCMVEGPAWDSGVAALKASVHRIEVGLHLNLTHDFREAASPKSVARLILLAYSRLLDRAQIRQVLERQFDRFETDMNRIPDFVDGHQHVHQLPVVRHALLEVMNDRFGPVKPWLRETQPPASLWNSGLPRATSLKANLIGWLGARQLGAMARQNGYRQNNRLLGVYGFEGSEAGYLEKLKIWLSCASTGDVLMCHPSLPWSGDDPLQGPRNQEYRALSSEAFSEMLKSTGIEIGPVKKAIA